MLKKIFIVLILIVVAGNLCIAGVVNDKPKSENKPKTYSINDLIDELSGDTWITDGWYKPADALARLDYAPVCASYTSAKKKSIAKALLATPKYKNKSRIFSTNVDWTKKTTFAFDWDKYWDKSWGRKGDLIFTRGTGTAAEIVKRLSHWTHVAFVYDKGQVFEATPNTGVDVNCTDDTWKSTLTHYTCKRLKGVSYYDADRIVDWGISIYRYRPYIPSLSIAAYSPADFALKWSNKYDMASIYCSKLVYLCYKFNPFVQKDLDTGITGCYSKSTLVEDERPWTASVFNWIGVSPDDIYYSDELGPDFCHKL